jgi:hypothetical protein
MDISKKFGIGIKLNQWKKDIESHIGRALLCDSLVIDSCVEIINGKTHIISKNSIVNQGLINFINFLACPTYYGGTYYFPSYDGAPMRIGSDTTHGTVHTSTLLTAPIGAGIGTAPNVTMGATSNPSAGVYKVLWTCIWYPGTVTGTIGEVGHFLRIDPTLRTFGSLPSPSTYTMFSRMAAADGKFSPFAIDITYPLVITWTFTLTYAA